MAKSSASRAGLKSNLSTGSLSKSHNHSQSSNTGNFPMAGGKQRTVLVNTTAKVRGGKKQRTTKRAKTPPIINVNGAQGFMFSSPKIQRPVNSALGTISNSSVVAGNSEPVSSLQVGSGQYVGPGILTPPRNGDITEVSSPLSSSGISTTVQSALNSPMTSPHVGQHPPHWPQPIDPHSIPASPHSIPDQSDTETAIMRNSGQSIGTDDETRNVLFSPPRPTHHHYNTRSSLANYGKLHHNQGHHHSAHSHTGSEAMHPANMMKPSSSAQFQSILLANNMIVDELDLGNLSEADKSIFYQQLLMNHQIQHTMHQTELDTSDLESEDILESYMLIKSLLSGSTPQLPPCRISIPQTDRITLVLDLDETLVHCSTDRRKMPHYDLDFNVTFQKQQFNVFVRTRPGLLDFLEKASSIFQIVIFTASQQIYADKLLDLLDPQRKYTSLRLFRDSCVFVDGTFVKDLRILGRDMNKVLIVDNAVEAFTYQLDNGIPIKSWFGEREDMELPKLFKFLHSMVGCVDVRPILKRRFMMYERIEDALAASDENSSGRTSPKDADMMPEEYANQQMQNDMMQC